MIDIRRRQKQLGSLIGVSFKSWRTTILGSVAATLYVLSEMEHLSWQNVCLAIAIGLMGCIARDAKVSSQDEHIR